jgi:branched-chain amino acid transport system permease protein
MNALQRTLWLALLIAALVMPWLADDYALTLTIAAMVSVMAALSAHVLSLAGLASLGQAAFLGVGAYTAANIAREWTALAPLGIVAGIMAAAVAAAVIGLVVAPTRSAAFMIATLAVGQIAYTLAEQTTPITHGGNGLTTPSWRAWPRGPQLFYDSDKYLFALGAVITVIGLVALLSRARIGMVLRATADHEPRTRANGYSTTAWLWLAYVLAGAIAGLAGAIHVISRTYVAPIDIGFDVSAAALLAAIIGQGRMLVTVLAAVGIVAVGDIVGNLWVGIGPPILGGLFIVTALVLSQRQQGWPKLRAWVSRK